MCASRPSNFLDVALVSMACRMSSIYNSTGGYCSEKPAVSSLPTDTWIQGRLCSHAGSDMSLILSQSQPFFFNCQALYKSTLPKCPLAIHSRLLRGRSWRGKEPITCVQEEKTNQLFWNSVFRWEKRASLWSCCTALKTHVAHILTFQEICKRKC